MTQPAEGALWATPDAPAGSGRTPARHGRRRPRRRGPVVALVLTVLVLAVVAAAASLAYDAIRAREALELARGDVRTLQDRVVAGDVDGAGAVLPQLQERARTAYERTHGPLWRVAAALPRVGADVEAVRTLSAVVDGLAADALPALMQATTVVDPVSLAPVDGRLDVAPIAAVAPQVVAADAAVQDARAALEAVDTSALVGVVADAVVQLRAQVTDVAMTTATAARAVSLLPPVLGADGPREYLLLVQNNAEQRATGGIPGTVVHLRAEAGAVTLVGQRSGGSLAGLAEPVLPLTPAEDALFGPLLATDMRDVTFTPDFPRSAALAREIWLREVGGTVDGVLSIDPGALAHVLGATGPVEVGSGLTLTADNAVETLLSTVYLEIEDPERQDELFAATAGAVFGAVVDGQGEAPAVIDALARGAREGRVMFWSVHPEEQARLAGTVLSGELRGSAGGSGVVGVYLNDGTEAKMGYYVDLDVTGTATACAADGSQTLQVTVRLSSAAPADAASLPEYVTGAGAVVPPGQVRTNVLFYAPEGGRIESSRVNSAEVGAFAQIHDGLGVESRTFTLEPGQTVTVELDVRTAPGDANNATLRHTPTARQNGPVFIPSAC
ncbi:DUF4012 domain-containing protein [Cellulomonas cellasea]|uniref:DUF4012 domain-containing protein n=2 Tax=Cellulomonas cellasea TaxID=43670 RepID=A0A0A0B5J7_9CELL|nr:DUF4012 domain-containing protein [Cellulomonas cellasea]KGM02125.1 hypothetical protein Q760_15420 [Cellulomonas cellasea DSM 20118]GEA89844.1 hypothetical protein CCE01nite_37930 [Cellulomonas cellasea]